MKYCQYKILKENGAPLTISSPALTAITSRAPAKSKTRMEERIVRVEGCCELAGVDGRIGTASRVLECARFVCCWRVSRIEEALVWR